MEKVKERAGLHGAVTLQLVRPDGSVTAVRRHNIILNGGIDFVFDAMAKADSRPAAMNYIALGSGSGAESAGAIKLESETVRKVATYTHEAGTSKATISATFDPGEATGAITEAGLCNAGSGGKFFDRSVFDVINKGASDILYITFEITLNRV